MATFTRRRFLSTSAAVGAGAAVLPRLARAQAANDTIGFGVIGCGGRGNELIDHIKRVNGAEVVALCDADSARTASTAETKGLPKATTYADLRKLLEDPAVDAVAIATCNHWHCLAAVWACQAGKDVYCEKPLSHRLWEGRALIKAGQDHNRIVAVGTQQRSDPMQAEIKDFLHEQKAIGAIKAVLVPRFGIGNRQSIGKLDAPLNPPESVDYNLWLGPAQDEPIFRTNLHYDWHWVWNTGDGECGNWGVHLLDDVINVVFRDKHKLPDRVASIGGRLVWNDAGQTPNVHAAYLEAGGVPIMFAVNNLPATPGGNASLELHDVETGYVVLGEGGEYRGWRGGGVAVDNDGKEIRKFAGDSGNGHMQNFVDSLRARDAKKLNAPVEIGHSSAGWAHVINAAYRYAKDNDMQAPPPAEARDVFDEMHTVIGPQLQAYKFDEEKDFRASPLLAIDGEAEKFTGEGADAANMYLDKPKYRGEFAIEG
jgi:hypothetical protein